MAKELRPDLIPKYWTVEKGIVKPIKLPGINHNSEGNTDLKDGRSKSSAFQNIYAGGGSYKKPGSKKSKKII